MFVDDFMSMEIIWYTHKTDNSYSRQSSKGRKKNRDKKKETVHI